MTLEYPFNQINKMSTFSREKTHRDTLQKKDLLERSILIMSDIFSAIQHLQRNINYSKSLLIQTAQKMKFFIIAIRNGNYWLFGKGTLKILFFYFS